VLGYLLIEQDTAAENLFACRRKVRADAVLQSMRRVPVRVRAGLIRV
jgi:hypothetical protein